MTIFAFLGADVIGINCNFGPKVCLKTICLMKEGLVENNLDTPLMAQPIGFLTPEVDFGDGLHLLPGHFLGTK